MLYLVAHLFFNGQSKNSNLFPLPELHETQFKKTVELWGREWRGWCSSMSLAVFVCCSKGILPLSGTNSKTAHAIFSRIFFGPIS